MSAGETARQVVQMKPEEEGVYRVHVYLYHKNRRIGSDKNADRKSQYEVPDRRTAE